MTATKPKPAAEAQDRDICLRLLHQQPGRRFNTVQLQMMTGIPSERTFRALDGAPGVVRVKGSSPSQFYVSA